MTAWPAAAPDGLDAVARNHLQRFVDGVDALAPGRVQGLYLYGSAALGDFRPGQSDLDFTAVAAAPWSEAVLAGLGALHARLASQRKMPSLDGIYVTWAELAGDPASAVAPGALEGALRPKGAFDANWAVWETLARYPLAVRGPKRPTVMRDDKGLRAFCLENLEAYWRPLARRAAAALPARPDLSAPAVVWCVPGVLRLAYTVATGDITSKSGAVRWALEHLDGRWHPLLKRALVLRQAGVDPDPAGAGATGSDGLGPFMEAVIARCRDGVGLALPPRRGDG